MNKSLKSFPELLILSFLRKYSFFFLPSSIMSGPKRHTIGSSRHQLSSGGSGISGIRGAASQKSEAFFRHMVSLGFKPSKNTNSEFISHMFQKQVTAAILEKLLKVPKANVIQKEEFDKFQILKAEGSVLYGDELQKALKQDRDEKKNLQNERNKADAVLETTIETCNKILGEQITILKNFRELNSENQITLQSFETTLRSLDFKADDNGISSFKDRWIQTKERWRRNSDCCSKTDVIRKIKYETLKQNQKLVDQLTPLVNRCGGKIPSKDQTNDEDTSILTAIIETLKQHSTELDVIKHMTICRRVQNAERVIQKAENSHENVNLHRRKGEAVQYRRLSSDIRSKLRNEAREQIGSQEQTLQAKERKLYDTIRLKYKNSMNALELLDVKAKARNYMEVTSSFNVKFLTTEKLDYTLLFQYVKIYWLKTVILHNKMQREVTESQAGLNREKQNNGTILNVDHPQLLFMPFSEMHSKVCTTQVCVILHECEVGIENKDQSLSWDGTNPNKQNSRSHNLEVAKQMLAANENIVSKTKDGIAACDEQFLSTTNETEEFEQKRQKLLQECLQQKRGLLMSLANCLDEFQKQQ